MTSLRFPIRKLILFALAPILVASGLAVFSVAALKKASSPKMEPPAANSPQSRPPADDPAPGTADFAWRQFASFLRKQYPEENLGPIPTLDPDWDGDWQNKSNLNLAPPNATPCPQSQKKFPAGSNPTPALFSTIASSNLEIPTQLKVTTNSTGQSPDCSGIVETVLYNSKASGRIRCDNPCPNLSLPGTYEAIAKPNTVQNVYLPPGAVIIKEMWQRIQDSGQASIWDPIDTKLTNNGTGRFHYYSSLTNFPTILIDQTSGKSCGTDNYLQLSETGTPQTAAAGISVPIACFVSAAAPDGIYILVGINVAHRTDNGWYWATFAWTNHIPTQQQCSIASTSSQSTSGGLCNIDQPKSLAAWNHYVMNRTDTQSDPTGIKTCFNPYLEGISRNGTLSNCTRCHQFATYVTSTVANALAPVPPIFGDPVLTGTSPSYGSSLTPTQANDVNKYLSGTVRTDFMWSLVSHLEPSK